MTKLMHVAASPRGDRSESRGLAEVFLETYRDVNPGVEVVELDIWDGSIPEFGPDFVAAKMSIFAGQQPAGAQGRAWREVHQTFERFADADAYLFSVPMWNHTIPYKLKQLIDVVSQPGLVFGFDPEHGYTGLLEGRRAAVVYTGAVWGPDRGRAFGQDFQAPYFDDWLRWAGIDQQGTVRFQPNLVTEDAATARQAAQSAARELAKRF